MNRILSGGIGDNELQISIEDQPKCGEDFCDNCGDCLICNYEDCCEGEYCGWPTWVTYFDWLKDKEKQNIDEKIKEQKPEGYERFLERFGGT